MTWLRLPGEGPAGGLVFWGAAHKERLVHAVILSYSEAFLRHHSKQGILEAIKKSLNKYFAEPLIYVYRTDAMLASHAINLLRSPTGDRINILLPSVV